MCNLCVHKLLLGQLETILVGRYKSVSFLAKQVSCKQVNTPHNNKSTAMNCTLVTTTKIY